MTARWRTRGIDEIADTQGGVVARRQLMELGWSDDDVRTAQRGAGWRALGGGVYVTHRGPLPPDARAWAVLLRCGPEAALASTSALISWGVPATSFPDGPWHVAVPRDRHPRVPETICLHRVHDHERRVHPSAAPTRHRVEAATLDAVAECGRGRQVADVLLAVVGRRLTDPARLTEELARRVRHPCRADVERVLADARTGVASQLEREYLHGVHRRHHLPAAQFNRPERVDGRTCYRDVDYGILVVELDGAAYHGVESVVADRRRDNDLVVAGRLTLRFGWIEVTGTPCEVAATVVRALGGRGIGRPCSPACALAFL